MTNKERTEKIKELKMQIENLEKDLHEIEKGCNHEIVVKKLDSTYCPVCEQYFGQYSRD